VIKEGWEYFKKYQEVKVGEREESHFLGNENGFLRNNKRKREVVDVCHNKLQYFSYTK
jgi:hypothetical protein